MPFRDVQYSQFKFVRKDKGELFGGRKAKAVLPFAIVGCTIGFEWAAVDSTNPAWR